MAHPWMMSAADAIPAWTAYVGDNSQTLVSYTDISIGSPWISIHDASSSLQPLHGNYSVLLQGSSGGASASATLSQTGLIPAGTLSLRFRAWGSSFQVSLNGQTLSLIPLANAGNYTVYGADISSFGGTLTELQFTALPTGNLFFDAVQFSTAAVPEPSTFALVGVGLLGFLFLRWSRMALSQSAKSWTAVALYRFWAERILMPTRVAIAIEAKAAQGCRSPRPVGFRPRHSGLLVLDQPFPPPLGPPETPRLRVSAVKQLRNSN